MLKVFRDNLKYLSWVLWLVIVVFVLFIFVDFGGIDLGAGPAATGTAAAVVGGEDVSYSQFERAYRQVEDQYRQAYGEQFSREFANQLGLPLQVLNQLVDERILLQEAARIGLEVTDEELRRSIVELPVFQEDGAFIGQDAYTDLLRRNGLRPEDFEGSQRATLLTRKVQEALARTVYVTPEEIEAAYREEAETATIRLLKLPATQFAEAVTADDAALDSFFAERQEDFRLPERRVVDYLLVDPSGLREAVMIEEDEVRSLYDANSEAYTTEEEVKARHILLRTGAQRTVDDALDEIETIKARVGSGEDFGQLASQLSDDPGSKDKGGDLGFFGRGAMVKPFEDAAFGAELGDMVGPIESSFGVHLIQVQAKRPGGTQPFEEVAAEIRERVLNERAAELASSKAAELAQRATDDGLATEALQALADSEAGVTLTTTGPFGRDDNVPGVGRATGFATSAFELAPGATSAPQQISRGWTVLTLREIQEPRLPELDEVRTEVTSEFRTQRQLDLARARLEEARSAIAGGESLDAVAEQLGITPEDAGPFGVTGTVGSLGQAVEVAQQALTLDEGAVGEPIVRENDVVLFEVSARTQFDPLTLAAERDSLRQRLENERLGELMQSFIAQRREELGVTYDPQVFEAFSPTPQTAS